MSELIEHIDRLEMTISVSSKNVLNTAECAYFMGVTEGRVRHLMSERAFPYSVKGNKAYFKKADIEEYLMQGMVESQAEIRLKAKEYLTKN